MALDFCKPDSDLVKPGRVSRREVEPYARILSEEFGDAFGFVGREVIQHDVDLFGGGDSGDDFRHETQEVVAGMPSGGLAMDLAGF
jgi:hypothetical protein